MYQITKTEHGFQLEDIYKTILWNGTETMGGNTKSYFNQVFMGFCVDPFTPMWSIYTLHADYTSGIHSKGSLSVKHTVDYAHSR